MPHDHQRPAVKAQVKDCDEVMGPYTAAGVVTFTILSAQTHGAVAPNWPTGIALGAGGLLGSYVGATLQSGLPVLTWTRAIRGRPAPARRGC